MQTVKTIEFQGKTVELVSHVTERPAYGKQRGETGEDASGNVYYKARTGRWVMAHHDTIHIAMNILNNA
jgi:hypothetical protein